jgi:alpha-beta hydrolase superfamily lysophospholipase
MFRTPVSMLLLGRRLRRAGLDVSYFGYSASFEKTDAMAARLVRRVKGVADGDYVLVSHSLGAVLIRLALPSLADLPPRACFFLAPPSRACHLARHFVERFPLLRLLTRDAGMRLAEPFFMSTLPAPPALTKVYAGTAGPVGTMTPFGAARNDGVLTVDDTRIAGCELVEVDAIHTLIMNSKFVGDDIVATIETIEAAGAHAAAN